MNCLKCSLKSCRSVESCGLEAFDRNQTASAYHQNDQQKVVQAAAQLVDGRRAGQLSRVEELMEFIKTMGYKKPGLAYCYGMEKEAKALADLFKSKGIALMGVSCTAGAHGQRDLNQLSELAGVSCNPISQARQLMADGVDFAILLGLCMGHDVLFHREFKGDLTTLVVKDRLYGHAPLDGLI